MSAVKRSVFMRLFGPGAQFRRLSEREDRSQLVRLGVKGIVLACIGTLFTILLAVLGSLCAENMLSARLGDGDVSFPFLSLAGAIVFFAGAVFFYFGLVFTSLFYGIYQRRLNDRGVGRAAVAVSAVGLIISVAVSVAVIMVIL